MGRKKKSNTKIKNTVVIRGKEFEVVTKTVKCLKPLPSKEGGIRMVDALKYLTKIMPQDDSSFETILSLASYLIYNNGLPASDKQHDLITHFLEYWEERGVLDVREDITNE